MPLCRIQASSHNHLVRKLTTNVCRISRCIAQKSAKIAFTENFSMRELGGKTLTPRNVIISSISSMNLTEINLQERLWVAVSDSSWRFRLLDL